MTNLGVSGKVYDSMKALLSIIVLILFMQPWAKANDIRDLQIEGISIGDSALNYFSKEIIKKNQRTDFPNSDKFSRSFGLVKSNMSTYDQIMIFYKTNDEKFNIYAIAGILFVDISKCSSRKEIIVKDLLKIFSNIENRDQKKEHDLDPESIVDATYMYFDNGFVEIACYDWSTKMEKKYKDNLRVSISNEEFKNWLNNEAY